LRNCNYFVYNAAAIEADLRYLSCTKVPVCVGPTGDCGSVCGDRHPSM
jgi:hypothetical protein